MADADPARDVLESHPLHDDALRRLRLGTSLAFLVNGLVFANWVPRIPEIRTALGIDEAALGAALVAVAVGALAAMTATGRAADRVGRRPPLVAGLVGCPVAFALLGQAPGLGYAALVAALALYGAAMGALDVAMNLEGAAAERAAGRPILASFHGVFSVGAMLGAGTGALAAGAGIDVDVHFALTAGAGLLLGLAALAALGPPEASPDPVPVPDATAANASTFPPPGPPAGPPSPVPAPSASIVALGALAFCVLLAEGAVADWSAVLLVDHGGTDAAGAGVAFAAFAAAMAIGRLTGDRVMARVGRRVTVAFGSAACGLGIGVALLGHGVATGALGFGLAGLGISCTFPALIAEAVAAARGHEGRAVARLSSIGYTGFLVGPALIGFVAAATSLPTALAGLSCLLGLAGVGAWRVLRR